LQQLNALLWGTQNIVMLGTFVSKDRVRCDLSLKPHSDTHHIVHIPGYSG